MADLVQFGTYSSKILVGAGPFDIPNPGGSLVIVGAHNIGSAAQTGVITLKDAVSGTVLGVIPALAVGAFWTPISPGILVPSGHANATSTAALTNAGVALFVDTIG